jgi:hypothetical protein
MERRLRCHVEHLAGTIGPRTMQRPAAWDATVAYIHDQLHAAAGPVQRERFAVGQQTAENLYVDWPGAAPKAPMLIVGAHYDTVETSPGADDNASAVAALIEVARVLAHTPMQRRLRLIAFANEEEPHGQRQTMGSQHHAQQCVEQGLDVEMVALEMLGFYAFDIVQRYPTPLHWARRWLLPREANFLGMVSNLRSAGLLRRMARGFKGAAALPCVAAALPAHRLIRRSDHGPFWDMGYRAMMITDTSFLRNRHYHQPTDTPDTLNYPALAQVTEGLAHAIGRLAGRA